MINIINLSLDIIQVQALSHFSVLLLARGTALFVLAAVFAPIKVSNIWFLMLASLLSSLAIVGVLSEAARSGFAKIKHV